MYAAGVFERRPTSQMPFRRQHDGLTAADRRLEARLWRELVAFLAILGGLAHNAVVNGQLLLAGLAFATVLLNRVLALRVVQWRPHQQIDKVIIFYCNLLYQPLL